MRFRRVVAIALVVLGAAGCSSSGSDPTPTPTAAMPSSRSTPPPSPSSTAPTLSANATAALAAYRNYIEATYRAERAPGSADISELRRLAVDPELGELQQTLADSEASGIALRGTPPTSRLVVVSDAVDASPWPKVVVADCPTVAPTWIPFVVRTGKPANIATSAAPPPHRLVATVIYYRARWAVSETTTDRNTTCTP